MNTDLNTMTTTRKKRRFTIRLDKKFWVSHSEANPGTFEAKASGSAVTVTMDYKALEALLRNPSYGGGWVNVTLAKTDTATVN